MVGPLLTDFCLNQRSNISLFMCSYATSRLDSVKNDIWKCVKENFPLGLIFILSY